MIVLCLVGGMVPGEHYETLALFVVYFVLKMLKNIDFCVKAICICTLPCTDRKLTESILWRWDETDTEWAYSMYRVSGQLQSIVIAKKSETDTEYFSILFRYFFRYLRSSCIMMMSWNEIQTEHNTLDLMSLC